MGRVECLLKLAGVHDLAPTDGPTGYFGTRLEEAVKAFQKDHGLRTDGEITPGGETLKALARTLQSMGRHGDTVLAHLTPGEAQFLHEITDGGSINPMTGLVEFWFGFGGEDTDAGSYEGAVSAAAGDESLSDADFWGGYETATAAFYRSNNGCGDGGGAEAPTANSSSPLSGKTTPPVPPTTPDRTYDDEISRRERLNTIEARRRERNKPNLLEETPRVTDNRTLEDDDQHLNFVDPLPGPTDPTDPNRKETQEPVNSKRQIQNIFEHHRTLEEIKKNKDDETNPYMGDIEAMISHRISYLESQKRADHRNASALDEKVNDLIEKLDQKQRAAVNMNDQFDNSWIEAIAALAAPVGIIGRAIQKGAKYSNAVKELRSHDLPVREVTGVVDMYHQSVKATEEYNKAKAELDSVLYEKNWHVQQAMKAQQEINRLRSESDP